MRERILVIAVAAVAFVAYWLTMYPSLSGGDAGELAAAVATGGVIHPPGYPLYAILGSIFLLLGGHRAAEALATLSAVCGAGAAAFLFAAVRRWSSSNLAALVAAGLFAFSPLVWHYATSAEVFATNDLIVAALLYVAVRFAESQSARWAYAGALLVGLGISNHQTSLFAAIPLAGWSIWAGRKLLRDPKMLFIAFISFGLGLLPYLWLPIAGTHNPEVTWGETDTWSGFWSHVLRSEYGTFRLAPKGVGTDAHALDTTLIWLADLRNQLGWIGLALAAAGLFGATRLARERRYRFLALFVAPVIISVGVMAVLGNLPIEKPLFREIIARFWLQPDLFVCAWCGLGVLELQRRSISAWLPAAVAAVVLLMQGANYRSADRHNNTLVKQYGEEILRALPQNALVIAKGDLITNSIRYLQSVGHRRPDVRIVDQELLAFPWAVTRVRELHPEITLPGDRFRPSAPGAFDLLQLIDANVDRFPIVICGGVRDDDVSIHGAYDLWPLGLCDTAHPRGKAPTVDEWIQSSEEALPRIDFTGQARPPGSWEEVVWGDYWEVRQTRAAHLLSYAGHEPLRRDYILKASQILSQIVAENPDVPSHVWRNLATSIGRYGLETPEQKHAAAEAWRHYVLVAPPDDPTMPAILREIEKLGP